MPQHNRSSALLIALLLACTQLCAAAPPYYTAHEARQPADNAFLHSAHGRRLTAEASGARRAALAAEGALGEPEGKVSDLGLESLQSDVECKPAGTGSTPEPLVCIFRNLLIWNGNFHYLGAAPPAHEWAVENMQAGGAKLSKYVVQEAGEPGYGYTGAQHSAVAAAWAQREWLARHSRVVGHGLRAPWVLHACTRHTYLGLHVRHALLPSMALTEPAA